MCDQAMVLNYVQSLQDTDLRDTCLAAASGGDSIELQCACWSGLDQDWLYANLDCKWEEDDDQTLVQNYNMYCMTDRTHQIFSKRKSNLLTTTCWWKKVFWNA